MTSYEAAKRRIFDVVASRMAAQGGPCINKNGQPTMINGGGKKCAVGHLFKEEVVRKCGREIGCTVVGLYDILDKYGHDALNDGFWRELSNAELARMESILSKIVALHDNLAAKYGRNKGFMGEFERGLNKLRRNYRVA